MVEKNPEKDKISSIKYLDRGMNTQEVKTLLTAPMGDRERAFFRALYGTWFRANELLQCNIEDYNKATGEITALHTKNKYSPKTKSFIKSPPKHMILSRSTQLLFKRIIGNRKRGAIFVSRQGKRLSITFLQVFIDELATRIGIQQLAKVTDGGKYGKRKQHLVTLKALREAGERHCDLAGADSDVTARGAQHSALVKEKHYKKSSWEEVQEQVRKYHPAFQE